MIIKDCAIPQQYQRHIESVLVHPQFPWTFLPEVTTYASQGKNTQPAFSHIAFDKDKTSQYYDIFYSLLLSICGSLNYEIQDLYRIRIGCLLKTTSNDHNLLHVDYPFPHDTILYYVNSSDGDTVIHTSNGIHSVSPKSGRVLIFEGSNYHASSNPTNHTHRFVITYNLKGQFYEDPEDIPN